MINPGLTQIELLAKVLEYEHALEHVKEAHEPQCPDCASLALSALRGVNREMCREMAIEILFPEGSE